MASSPNDFVSTMKENKRLAADNRRLAEENQSLRNELAATKSKKKGVAFELATKEEGEQS